MPSITCQTTDDGLVGASLAINVVLSLGIIGVNAYIIYKLAVRGAVAQDLAQAGAAFEGAIKAAEFARLPPAAVAVLAHLGGVSVEEVNKAYEKDSMERRAIVYAVMGRTAFAKKFADDFPSKFMRRGYEEDTALPAVAPSTPPPDFGVKQPNTDPKLISAEPAASPVPAQ